MTNRLQNMMLAMLLALTTLVVGFSTLSQNPTSGGYQLFEQAASGVSTDNALTSLGNFAPAPESASEYANAPNNVPPLTQIDDFVDLTAHRRGHILSGHLSGAGKPGKTEFPSNWDADRIMHQVSDVATDPNATRGLGKWDSPYALATRDGIEIRVDFYPDLLPSGLPHPNTGKISTAYPTNTPVNP